MRYLLLLLILLGGCMLKREQYDRTPRGWHVHWVDQGTITTGLHSKFELMLLFDAAMERSMPECAAKVGLPESYVRGKISDNDALYTLVDNFYFPIVDGIPAVDAPTAKYAAGETLSRIETYVAFYNKQGPVVPPIPVAGPQWAQHISASFPGQVYYGSEVDGDQYPALGYELHWQFTEVP